MFDRENMAEFLEFSLILLRFINISLKGFYGWIFENFMKNRQLIPVIIFHSKVCNKVLINI